MPTYLSELPVTPETIALALVDYDMPQSDAIAIGIELLARFDITRRSS